MELEAIILRHLDWLVAIVLFMIGWYFGTRAERRHLATLAEDEQKNAEAKLQKVHDKYIAKIEEMLAEKDKEIMTV